MLEMMKALVAKDLNDSSIGDDITEKDIYVVWSCKILKNWKALLSTDVIDKHYYEVTFNGDKEEFYIDKYIKTSNERVALKCILSNVQSNIVSYLEFNTARDRLEKNMNKQINEQLSNLGFKNSR